MKQTQLVSIIIPVYNAELYLDPCISSVLNQSYKHIEVILVNDGSTDNSEFICNYYASKDNRIVVFKQENKGPSHARNTGVKNARGVYIQFVDADDTLEAFMTERLVQAIQGNDLVLCGYAFIQNKMKTKHIPKISGGYTHHAFLLHVGRLLYDILLPSPCNKLYRTDIIKDNSLHFQEHVSLGEDLLFNLDYLTVIQTIMIEPMSLYNYHHNENSLSQHVNDDYLQDQVNLIENVRLFLQKHNAYSDENIRYINKVFTQSIINTLSHVLNIDSTHNKSETLHRISKLTSTKLIRDHLPYFTEDTQAHLMYQLIKYNLNRTLYVFLVLKHTIRTRLHPLFNLLKKMTT